MHSFVATGISDVLPWCNNSTGKGKTKDERLRGKGKGERGKVLSSFKFQVSSKRQRPKTKE